MGGGGYAWECTGELSPQHNPPKSAHSTFTSVAFHEVDNNETFTRSVADVTLKSNGIRIDIATIAKKKLSLQTVLFARGRLRKIIRIICKKDCRTKKELLALLLIIFIFISYLSTKSQIPSLSSSSSSRQTVKASNICLSLQSLGMFGYRAAQKTLQTQNV